MVQRDFTSLQSPHGLKVSLVQASLGFTDSLHFGDLLFVLLRQLLDVRVKRNPVLV